MNILRTIPVVAALAAASAAQAGAVVDLAPSQFADGFSGVKNSEFHEIIGTVQSAQYTHFEIYGSGEGNAPLYEGMFLSSVVRSNMTGNMTFNYRIYDPNPELAGRISHVEVRGFEGWQTRVEYRNELTSPGVEGPYSAQRDALGDMIDFGFAGGLDTAADSKFFFAMTNTDTFYENAAVATIFLETGESVSMVVQGANPAVPAPGAFALLGGAGLLCSRRRR